MYTKLIFISLLGLYLPGFAQFQQNVPLVKPISPDAAAMFKVLEKPIGSYTGTVPVNFPLMSLNTGELTAGLSLNYNSTGGIRVEEIASWVGLGFSLSDGAGRIIQTINSLADDRPYGFLSTIHNLSTFSCSLDDLYASAQNQYDTEPDIYMYNFGGRTGKFFFKQDGTVCVSENSGIKVEYDTTNIGNAASNGLRQFIIIDEKGNKYYFGQNKNKTINYRTESTCVYQTIGNTGNNLPANVSRTWYLVEAYDLNEENSLKYTYVANSGVNTTFSGGLLSVFPIGSCAGFNTAPSQVNVATNTVDYMVSKIDAGRNGYLLFNSSADRRDATSLRKLNNIEQYDADNVFKKRIKFNYGYFNNGEGDAFMRRLKLVTFSEFGTVDNTGDSISYKFTYNETMNLPSRFSNSVDLWGYYNGKFNSDYFPNFYYQFGTNAIRQVNKSNRSAIPACAQANILTRITYPTGGYRQFVYEGNQALMSTSNEHYMDDEYTVPKWFNNTAFYSNISPAVCLRQSFTINSTDGGANFSYNLDVGGCSNYTIKIYKVNLSTDTLGGTVIRTLNNTSEYNTNLLNGNYRMEIIKSSMFCNFNSLNGNWKESTLSTASIVTPSGPFNRNNINAGGVRVRQLIDYDPVTGKTSTRDYKYKLYSTDSTFTSGVLISPVHMLILENAGSYDGQFLAVHSSSCYPLASEGGSYVVYPEVRTIEYGNGRIDRKYSFMANTVNGGYPPIPPSDNAYLRGNLENEKYYDNNGTLIRKVTYGYTYGNGGGQVGYRDKPYYYDNQDNGLEDREYPRNQAERPAHGDCNNYYLYASSTLQAAIIDSIYSPAGAVSTQTNYSYTNYRNQLLLNKVTTTANNGASKVSTCKYPFTDNSQFTFFLNAADRSIKTKLLSGNALFPLEITDSLKPATGTANLISGNKYLYGLFNTNAIHLARVINYTAPTDSIVSIFTNYDLKGNLREELKANDIRTNYLWGYNNQYTVAKVVGSIYATVSGLINESILNAPANDNALRTELNQIRDGLAATKAMVTTYTYSPQGNMTSETDPSGKTTYYEYDALGRLVLVRDDQNNIIRKVAYNMAGAL